MADECFDMKEIKILILNDISLMILDTWNEVESTVKTIHVAGISEGTTAFHLVFFFKCYCQLKEKIFASNSVPQCSGTMQRILPFK